MTREARKKSMTGIYHVMLRGIDKRDIFISHSDYKKFLYYIEKAKQKSYFVLYAYCLMTNHVHLLIKTETEPIGKIVSRITVGYAQYHNIKNGRTGHLFQNRFKSEPVDTRKYFLTVIRYIHQNPLKAGLVDHIKDYKWSSYKDYLIKTEKRIIETTLALDFFSNLSDFRKFMDEKNTDQCLEHERRERYTDDELRKLIYSLTEIDELYKLNKRGRDAILKNIKENTRASNRQLSRVLDIGRGILDRI